jgi:ABC-type lipoprotein release transport system permease subunit
MNHTQARVCCSEMPSASTHDAVGFATALLFVGGTSALAFAVPARRALRSNPAEVLRGG